jgi:uncharacterized protein (TIGR03067 family)
MRRVLPLLAVLSLAPAPVPPHRLNPLPDNLKALQGTWEPVKAEAWFRWHGCWGGSCVYHSVAAPADKVTWGIEGDRLTWRSQWAITLNTKKEPAELDLVRTSREPAFRRRGLYKLEGDTLIISLRGYPDNPWRARKRRNGSPREASG